MELHMYYGEGRLRGNIGIYVVEQAEDAWDAERLLRNATASKEQVHRPKLVKAEPAEAEAIYDSLESADDPTRRNKVYKLGYGVSFFEFAELRDFEAQDEEY